MNKIFISSVFAFCVGAAAGIFCGYHYAIDHFEKEVEIHWKERSEPNEKKDENLDVPIPEGMDLANLDITTGTFTPEIKSTLKELRAIYAKPDPIDYTGFSTVQKDISNDKEESDPIRVISGDEYGENMAYDRICLSYYRDHVLADDDDEIIRNADSVIGTEAMADIDELEDGITVYVVNDTLKSYYEIFIDNRTYSEVIDEWPDETRYDF